MKNKNIPIGQYAFETVNIEGASEDFLEKTAPLIGRCVQLFNELELYLDSAVCNLINGRTDIPGLAVITGMSFSYKLKIFDRYKVILSDISDDRADAMDAISTELKQLNNLRNQIVHADWESAYDDGFTRCKLKANKQHGVHHTYIQFSEDSLENIIRRLDDSFVLFNGFF